MPKTELNDIFGFDFFDDILTKHFSSYGLDDYIEFGSRYVVDRFPTEPVSDVPVDIQFISDVYNGKGEVFESEVYNNPTYGEAWIISDEMLGAVNDWHIFFEGLRFIEVKNGVHIYQFIMGS